MALWGVYVRECKMLEEYCVPLRACVWVGDTSQIVSRVKLVLGTFASVYVCICVCVHMHRGTGA